MTPTPLGGVADVLGRARGARPDLDALADLATPLLAHATAAKIVALDRLVRRLDPGVRLGPRTRVLDVGVGRGRVLALLGALGAGCLSGLDDFGDPTYGGPAAMVAHLAARGVRAGAHDASAAPWPLPDAAYDLVVSFDTLEHLHQSPRALLGEARRVLAPGGIIVLGLPNAVALYQRLRVVAGRTNYPRFAVWWDQVPWRGHVRESAPGELTRMLEGVGLAPTPEIGLDCVLPARMGR